MTEFDKVKKYIEENNMIKRKDSVIVGLSGGADSVCLLKILTILRETYELDITAVHVHHGIRGEEADRDMKFAEKYCGDCGVKIKVFYYDVPKYAKENGMSEEEAGRKIRYEAFESIRAHGGKIAVAHNLNDSVETFVHNLCRGSGLTGLSGIKPVQGHVIRPILCLERREIENYLNTNQIPYIEDSTNFYEEYTRNKIRLNVLPYLTEHINKESIIHINNVSRELSEAERYLNEQAENLYNQMFYEYNNCIYADKYRLEKTDEYMRSRIIRLAIYHLIGQMKDITRKHIEDIGLLLKKQSGRCVVLPYGITVHTEQNHLIIERQRAGEIEDTAQEAVTIFEQGTYEFGDYFFETQLIDVEKENVNPEDLEKYLKKNQKLCTKCFNYDKIVSNVQIRNRRAGDYLTINRDGGKKKLKSYMIDEKIPAHMRDKIPVIADGSHIMWVYGGRMSEGYKVTAGTKRILKITGKEKEEDVRQDSGINSGRRNQ